MGVLQTKRRSSIIEGQRLRKIREKNDYSLEEIAKILGLSCSEVEAWEYGETSPPDISYLKQLASHYGVNLDYFIKGVECYKDDA